MSEAWWSVAREPGLGTCLTLGSVWVVLASPRDSDVVRLALAPYVGTEQDADGLLEALVTAVRIRDLPAFALAAEDGDDVRVVARHPARATVTHAVSGSIHHVEADPGCSWTDRQVPGPVQQVVLRLGPAGPEGNRPMVPTWPGLSSAEGLTLVREGAAVGRSPDTLPPDQPGEASPEVSSPPPDGDRPYPGSRPDRTPVGVTRGWLRIDHGPTLMLDDRVLIGREPSSPEPGLRLVRVADPDGLLSRSHLRLERHQDGVVVADLGSSHGTVLHRPGKAGVRLRPHEPQTMPSGSTLTLAGRVRMTYTEERGR